MQQQINFAPEMQGAGRMTFVGGKWDGVLPGDLELGDLAWIAQRSNRQIDRVIAQQEIMRRKEIARKGAL